MPKKIFFLSVFLFVFAIVTAGALPAKAASDQQELIDSAQHTMARMLEDEFFLQVPKYLEKAKAVLIVPSLFKAGFFFGAEGGNGVLLVKNTAGEWSNPAFYTMAGASLGLQFGAQDAEVLLIVLTDGGLHSVLNSKVKLGADASFAVGPVGAGIEGATTTNFDADIVVFSRAVGLFGGVAGEGTMIYARDAWNQLYYGDDATPKKIVLENAASNPGADALRDVLAGK